MLWIVSRVLLCSWCVAMQLLGCLNGFLATTIKKSPTPSILLLQSSSYFTVSTIETKLTIIKTWKGAHHSEKIKTVSSLHLIHPFTRKGWSEGGKKERESERAWFSSPQATVINLHPVRLWLKRCAQAKATHALFSSESVLLTSSWSKILPGSWWSIRQCLFQIKLEEVWQSVAYGRGVAGYLFVACCHASCCTW